MDLTAFLPSDQLHIHTYIWFLYMQYMYAIVFSIIADFYIVMFGT